MERFRIQTVTEMILARLETDAELYLDSEMMDRLVLESFQGYMD